MTDFLNQIAIPGLVRGAIAGLFALGFVVVYRTSRVLNFAHGQLVMLTPLLVLVVTDLWGMPVWLGFVIALAALAAVALLEERIAIRPFIQGGHAMPWILSTLGFSIILAELMSIPFRGIGAQFPWGVPAVAFPVGALVVSWSDIATVAAFVVLVLLILSFDRWTTAGLRLRAVAEDSDGAAAIGISPSAASRLTFLIAAGVAAVTGLLLGSTQLITGDLGLGLLFGGFVAAALGGLDSVLGTLVGGFIVGLVGQAAGTLLGGAWVQVALFSVLLVVFLARPQGIFGHASVRKV